MTLTEFLLARIAEDEAVAAAAAVVAPEPWEVADRGWLARLYRDGSDVPMVEVEQGTLNSPNPGDLLRCFERFSPVRASAECEAKRRIVAEHPDHHEYCGRCSGDGEVSDEGIAGVTVWYPAPMPWPCPTLCLLALLYVTHPDYDAEWRP